jgi:hypothetical protein
MEGKGLGELKEERDVSNNRRRSDSNAAMKRVNSHFFSAPIILLLLLLSVLGLCLCFFLFQLAGGFVGVVKTRIW